MHERVGARDRPGSAGPLHRSEQVRESTWVDKRGTPQPGSRSRVRRVASLTRVALFFFCFRDDINILALVQRARFWRLGAHDSVSR